jgi:hypothetical protein
MLKQLYREKIVLLNVIGHDEKKVEEFRHKVRMNPQSTLKELEGKYQIVTSGLLAGRLCPHCVESISVA